MFFVAFFLFFFTKFRSSNSSDTIQNSPPEPWKLPLLGHLHHLSGALPHQALGSLAQKLGPIIRLQLGQVSAIVISSPIFAKEIMKTHDQSFANRPKLLCAEIVGYNYTSIAFSPYGDYWRQMRKLCILELLSVKKVRSFQNIREEESWNLIDSITKHGSKAIDLSEKIFKMMNVIACRDTIGSRYKDEAMLLAHFDEIISLSSGFDVADLFPSIKVLQLVTNTRNKLFKVRNNIDKIFDNIILDHQEERASGLSNRHEDLLDVLLRLKDDGGLEFPLAWDNVKGIMLEMLVAGTDTSSVVIEWAMSELMKNPRVMKKVQTELRHALKKKEKIHESDIQELDYLKQVIKETCRLHPPVPLLLPRECRETCEIGGYDILRGTKVIINTWKIGRDPDYWIDPESFIPERFCGSSINVMGTDFELLPFGAGRRMCPGMTLGLANVELPLAMLLYHFDWELPNGVTPETLDMSEVLGATLKRKNNLHLVPSDYHTKQTLGLALSSTGYVSRSVSCLMNQVNDIGKSLYGGFSRLFEMASLWQIRSYCDSEEYKDVYDLYPELVSLKIHHGGRFTKFPGRRYLKGKTHYVELVDTDKFSVHELEDMMHEIGYKTPRPTYYHFVIPGKDLDFGLHALGSDMDILEFLKFVPQCKVFDIYIEHWSSSLNTYNISPGVSNVVIEQLPDDEVEPVVPKKKRFKPLLLEWTVDDELPSGIDNSMGDDVGKQPLQDELPSGMDKSMTDDVGKQPVGPNKATFK
ncbi:hypothetical protein OSB04_002780 [Centaurea solstitialis]|uniref:PB1-like domain-containing protein n=1 Tax=Centaurea solstitialis TaxID=347529 RepID=A0AA38TVE3_9ASTR|nr:hypothetical protein OSB04_002780 [Centaurea solstitialis]